MRRQKKYLIIICLMVAVFNSRLYSQTKKNKETSWLSLKEAAHKIGFCVYHVEQESCDDHSKVKIKLKKDNGPDSEFENDDYFELKPVWAKKRLKDLAKKKGSKSKDYLILFDIDQNWHGRLHDSTRTSNSYKMFSVLDLKDTLAFKTSNEANRNLTFYISSNREKSILTNTLWREFMSHREGKYDTKIAISLTGANVLSDYQNFKATFMKFIEK